MSKTLFSIVIIMVSVLLAVEASAFTPLNAPGRKLMTKIAFGPECTNSYFKSGPGFKKTPGKVYKSCCDEKKGFICATYTGQKPSSTYSACMTLAACKASNGGSTNKSPGWNCDGIDGNTFKQCANFFAKP